MARAMRNRHNDLFYDPLYIVSGPKDYYKQARIATMKSSVCIKCPIFPNMFTDLPHLSKSERVIRATFDAPRFEDRFRPGTFVEKIPDIVGVDRYRFFQNPVSTKVPAQLLNLTFDDPGREESIPSVPVHNRARKANKKIQTQFRESSAQTSPWQPDYKVVDGGDPEILKLDFLKWGCGLPAGMHEVKMIERARMKRQWEKSLPPASNKKSIDKRRDTIAAMERDEWAFREQEIQDVQNLRYELLEKMLVELLENTKRRSELKLRMFCKDKLAEKDEKLAKLRRESEREKRRLDFNYRGIIMKYRPINVIPEHADPKSELYAPMTRHGENPKRWHQVIDEHMKKYKATYSDAEMYDTVPKWLENATKMRNIDVKLPGTRLCQRETKWSKPVLKELHEELKCLRKVTKQKCNLRVRILDSDAPPPTPEVDPMDEIEESNTEGAILMQSVIRGRAGQIMVFEGRDSCRELILELRSTHAVLDEEKTQIFRQKLEVKYDQREEELCMGNTNKLQEALDRLQGSVVGTLLDFLNKELRRLLDERKAHALGLMAERERFKREAAEAGRRQAELRRRKEHDEMFRQVVKMHQETVDLYLEDIIAEGMDFASADEAKDYVMKLGHKFDQEMENNEEVLRKDLTKQEELVAELVHHFVLPEVEKGFVRQRIKNRQKRELINVHNELFETIETLPKPPPRPVAEKRLRTRHRPSVAADPNLAQFEVLEGMSDEITVTISARPSENSEQVRVIDANST